MLAGWHGKILGAILGYVIGRGLLGAIVGFVLGHQFDAAGKRRRSGSVPGNGTAGAVELRRAFFETTFQVMGHVAKSDGLVTEQEIDAARGAMRRFSLAEADRLLAIEGFTAGKHADVPR